MRLLRFFAPDLLKITAFAAAAIYLQSWVVAALAAVVTVSLAFFAWRRLQTASMGSTLTISATEIVFANAHRLAIADVKDVRVEVWRAQKLLVLEGHGDGALLYLPDVYDVPVESLAARVNERRTV